MPRVTVVTAALNASEYIAETIQSVLQQTYRDFEYVVIDDGSSDDTVEVVSRFGPRVTLVQQRNSGVGGARNRGFEIAAGEYVAVVDADDVWAPDKLEQQVCSMDASPQAGVCYTDCSSMGADGSVLEESMIVTHPPLDCLALMTSFSPIVTSSVMYRRELLEARPYRLDLALAEDFYVHLKALWRSRGYALFIDEPLVRYRKWDGSTLRKAGGWERGKMGLKSVEAFIEDMSHEDPLSPRMIRDGIAFQHFLWAWYCIESGERLGFALHELQRAAFQDPGLSGLAIRQVVKLMASRAGMLRRA